MRWGNVTLGFITGHRPSHLRPIRRRGATADLNLYEGTRRIRRSETWGRVVERTKNKLRQKLALPAELIEVLREHIQFMEFRTASLQARSDLRRRRASTMQRASSTAPSVR